MRVNNKKFTEVKHEKSRIKINAGNATVFRCGFYFVENSDIYFEEKAVLYFDFYAFRDVFRRNCIVQQDRIASNRFELERTIPKN